MSVSLKRIIALVLNKGEDSLTKQVVENSTYQFGTNLVSRAGSLIFTIIIARILMPELFGLYNLTLSIILTINTFADLGINSALSRYLSDSLSRKKINGGEIRSRIRFLFILKFLLAFVIASILFLLSPWISESLFSRPEMIVLLRIGAIYIFVIAIPSFLGAIFGPLKKIKYNLFAEIIVQGTKIVLFLLLVQLYMGVSTVFYVLITSCFLAMVFYLIVILIKYRYLLFGKLVKISKKKIAIFLGWSIILSSSFILFSHIDTFMLGLFVENNFIGYYSALLSLIISATAIISFSPVFMPVFTQLKNKKGLKRAFGKVIKVYLIIAIPLTILLMIIILPVMKIIYGADYIPQEYFVPILISAILLSLLVISEIFTGIFTSLFLAKEKVKIPAIILLIITGINIILNYSFIKIALIFGPQWALVSVSLATVLTRYTNFILLRILAKKEFRFLYALKNKKELVKQV